MHVHYILGREKGQYIISSWKDNIVCERGTAEMIQVCRLIYVYAFLEKRDCFKIISHYTGTSTRSE